MSQEPIEVDSVEYVEATPIPQSRRGVQGGPIVYQSEGLPCCSGCGCLGLTILVLMFSSTTGLLTGIVILLAATVLATAMLRIAGVRRWTPAYAYILVPVFLVTLNLTTKFFRGAYPYTWPQLIGAILLIYVFLYLARGLGRR